MTAPTLWECVQAGRFVLGLGFAGATLWMAVITPVVRAVEKRTQRRTSRPTAVAPTTSLARSTSRAA